MSAALHRSSPRDLLRRAVVWFVGFAATGYVFHDVNAAQLHELGVRDWLYVIACPATVLLSVGYFAFVMPDSYAHGLAGIAGYGLTLGGGLIGVHWLGVKVIEARQ